MIRPEQVEQVVTVEVRELSVIREAGTSICVRDRQSRLEQDEEDREQAADRHRSKAPH